MLVFENHPELIVGGDESNLLNPRKKLDCETGLRSGIVGPQSLHIEFVNYIN